jgi:cell filamentation protein
MKQRLLVMNGQLLLQSEQAGEWRTDKVEKAASVKPGIYAIYLATPADKKKVHDGPIIHIDSTGVYQQVGRNLILHARSDFPKVPDLGAHLTLNYSAGRCVATPSTIKSGRKIS